MILKVPNNKTKQTRAISARLPKELHPSSTSSNSHRVLYQQGSLTLITVLQSPIFLDPSQPKPSNLKVQVYSIPIRCSRISNLSRILSLDLKAVSLNSSPNSSHNFSLFSTRVRIRPQILSNKINRVVFSTSSHNKTLLSPQEPHLYSTLNSRQVNHNQVFLGRNPLTRSQIRSFRHPD